jgi:PKD repeat protein
MKRFLLTLITLACLLGLSAACSSGGGSSVAPPGTAPPVINTVTPLTGQTGAAVTFSTTHSGSAITDWEWQFGGGVVPNLSHNASPAVTLGDPGTYHCKVVGTNAWFETTLTFDLVVTP